MQFLINWVEIWVSQPQALSNKCVANSFLNPNVKKNKNRPTFAKVMNNNIVGLF